MRDFLNTNIELISKIDPSVALTDQQVEDIYTIRNLILNIPELATNKLNEFLLTLYFSKFNM